MAQLYICNAAFVTMRRDRDHWVMPGQIAEAGSWPLEISPDSFTRLAIDYQARGPEPEPEAAPQPVEPAKPEEPKEPEEPEAEEPPAPAKRAPGRPRKHHT